jgi:hypothetical protein
MRFIYVITYNSLWFDQYDYDLESQYGPQRYRL